jgi:O-antigen/teichoic acid export membrane protein
MEDLKGKTVRGGLVTIFGQTAKLTLRMGSLAVLARLLVPGDFGLVGMVTAVTGIFEIVKDAGLSAATVQASVISDEQISTLFWINMLMGAIFGLLTATMAPLLVYFYHEPRLLGVTMTLASGFVFTAAAVQHQAILQRQMRFTALATIEIISLTVSVAVGVGMAIGGFGYWALACMTVSLPATDAICVWRATRWIPGRPRRGAGVRSLLRFGGTVTLNGISVYLAYNFQNILLGRFWGAEALGIYGRAYQLISFPTSMLNSAIGTVAFPALSRLQDDANRFKSYFLKGYSLLLGFTLPATIACALFADDLIFVLLGPKWKDAVIIFRLLAPTILVLAMINPLGWLLYSTGLVGRSLRIGLVLSPIVIGAYFVGLPYGPRGVAFAYSTAMIFWLVPHLAWCVHGTVISLRDLLWVAGRPFIAGITAATLSYLVQFFLLQALSPFPRLVLGGLVLLGSYIWLLLIVMGQKSFYVDVFRKLIRPSSIEDKASVEI